MTNRELIESYIPFAKFLSAVCGPTCEVVLHDLSDIEHSIIYIENSITDRKAGDGLINFTFEAFFERENAKETFSANLVNQTAAYKGDLIRTSTFYIRNKANDLIGFLGVNQNYSELTRLCHFFERMANLTNNPIQQALSSEAAFSVKQFVNTRISAAMSRIGRSDVDALTKTERRRIIELLAQESLFTVKGCVNMTAKLLNVSVPTIYRYINSAKEDNA